MINIFAFTCANRSGAVRFFLGGGNCDTVLHLFQWYRSSPVRVQIDRELVGLINLIVLNKLLTNMIFPKSLKKFSGFSGVSYLSKVCSVRSGLSIAPTLDRFGRVQVKNDAIEKVEDGVTVSPPKKTHKC